MNIDFDVWMEPKWTEEGLSVSVYSQVLSQEPVLEDEAHWTWPEILNRERIPDSYFDLPPEAYESDYE